MMSQIASLWNKGVAACPVDAVPDIKAIAHYISHKKGGEGASVTIEQTLRVR